MRAAIWFKSVAVFCFGKFILQAESRVNIEFLLLLTFLSKYFFVLRLDLQK